MPKLFFRPDGVIEGLYTEAFDLAAIGPVTVEPRISHVEPAPDGKGWIADMAPVGGPRLGPYAKRSEALAAEVAWAESWLANGKDGEYCPRGLAFSAVVAHVEACRDIPEGRTISNCAAYFYGLTDRKPCREYERLAAIHRGSACTCPAGDPCEEL